MNRSTSHPRRAGRRLTAVLLTLCLLCSLLPAPSARAEGSWAQPYLDKLVSWGVMRGDQAGNLDPDRPITRSEYVSLVNRAFGYGDAGKNPFTDVSPSDWYYDDIRVAYQTGYFTGTSKTTASPQDTLTREQATVMLGRNLMLREELGESLDFTDGRQLSDWSRGIVKSAADEGIVKGYPDGSFQPQRSITRGEVAVMLATAIGTPVSTPGDFTLGSVYGNVTVSTSGVTLRNTVIAGDLYLTGGVGLGYVTLENVTVLGRIVASGAGEANKGDSSLILRNVSAPSLVVDSISNQFVTVRSEGDTRIERTSVRTPSYLEDATGAGYGFAYIELDGEAGTALEVAGNVKEIMGLTPNASINVAKGSALVVTVDEAAAGTTVAVQPGAEIKTLNLDTGVKVSGSGDIEHLVVNSAGSSAATLPDKVTVRPGLTANVSGEKMDTVTAAESSEAPRLLSGFPRAADLAPTSAAALFRTNKRGTVYWAVSSITEGSVGEADLLSPPSYSSKILKSGSIAAASSNTDYTARISGLTSGGSYYLSAVLEDARGQRSPVKVIAFTTPDDSVPGFASGYPVMTKITNNAAQVSVMPTKSCRLYYALLPKGSTAPKPDDFKANAVAGSLGFGSMDLTKNTARLFPVNDRALNELETYDLYLWLTDVDGGKSSPVKKLSFTTVDRTPPEFVSGPNATSVKETSVGLTAALNEAGTIYWVAVKQGEDYPKPLAGQTQKPELSSDTAKLQVASGMNGLKSGKAAVSAANKDVVLTVSGLTAQAAYDFYYVAQDKAGNYSAKVQMLTIHTLDTEPPTVTQEFTRTNDTQGKSPLPDTDVKLVFSEGIQDVGGKILLELYRDSRDTTKSEDERSKAAAELENLLRRDVSLYDADAVPARLVPERTAGSTGGWVIDYRNVEIAMDEGRTVITLKNGSNLNLKSGGRYYFQIENIADTSNNKNLIRPNPQKLPEFQTVFAQMNLTGADTSGTAAGGPVSFDLSFKAVPAGTANVSEGVYWDLLFWSSSNLNFDLYTREEGKTEWTKQGSAVILPTPDSLKPGISYTRSFLTPSGRPAFEALNRMTAPREYGLVITALDGSTERETWNSRVEVNVSAVAGSDIPLGNLATNVTRDALDEAVSDGVVEIGNPPDYALKHTFSDSVAPKLVNGYPTFNPGDSGVELELQLNRRGYVYYAVAPVGIIPTTRLDTGDTLTKDNWDMLPTDGRDHSAGLEDAAMPNRVNPPTSRAILNPSYTNALIKVGHGTYDGGTLPIQIDNLKPETQYCAYLVLKGDSQDTYSSVYCYGFKTTEVTRPVITLDVVNPAVQITVSEDANVAYSLMPANKVPTAFTANFSGYLPKAPNPDGSDTLIPDPAVPAPYRADGYTVLEAMIDSAGTGLGSVFDEYATEDAKLTFARLIRNQKVDTTNVVLADSGAFQASKPGDPVDCAKVMQGGTWYTFVAVGRSTLGSGDAFRAITPVLLPDTDLPMVDACSTSITTTLSDNVSGAYNNTYDGTVTVNFNKALYLLEQSAGTQKFTPVYLTDIGAAVAAGGVSINGVTTYSATGIKANIVPNAAAENLSPCESVTFTFTGIRAGSTISFRSTLCDQYGNNHKNAALVLTLTLPDKPNVNNQLYRPYFTVTPAWDNTK